MPSPCLPFILLAVGRFIPRLVSGVVKVVVTT